MGRTLATPTMMASNSGEVPHTAAAVDLVNVASLAVEKLNGCEEEVEGWQRSFVQLDFGQRHHNGSSRVR
jgi:hypothetical protein